MSNINVNNLTPLLGSGSSVSVSGSLVVKNDVTIGGHLYIGDQDTDSVTFSAEVSSSVIPDASVTYDLGSSTKKWNQIFLNSLVTHHITASGNISASGTGDNGSGSFGHVFVSGSVSASGNIGSEGTGSFFGGVDAGFNSATGSFGYISASSDISTSNDIYAMNAFLGNDLHLQSDDAVIRMGLDNDFLLKHNHSSTTVTSFVTGSYVIDATQDVTLDTHAGNIFFKDCGVNQLKWDLDGTSGEVIAQLMVDSDDLVFKQFDGTEVLRIDDDGDVKVFDDLRLTSDSSVFAMGAGNDFTITHDGTTGATLAGNPITIDSAGALNLFGTSINIGTDTDVAIDIDSTTFDLDASGNITIDTTGIFQLGITGGASSIRNVTDADAEDLTIALEGATNSSLILSSTGTGTDALAISTSAGSIDIDSADNITIDAADDISLTSTSADGLITLHSAHTAGQAILIDANAASGAILDIDAGIIDIDAQGATTIDSGATIEITATDTLSVRSVANSANAILLYANGGTNETIKIHADQGTGAGSIELTSDAGSIDINAGDDITVDAADDITITAADNFNVNTSTADGKITLYSGHTAGAAFHIDANADAGSILDIDAGILDIDVTGAATLDTGGNYTGTIGGAYSMTSTGAGTVDVGGKLTLLAQGSASDIAITSEHVAGQAILISANANAGSILDIDAGIVDADVQGLVTIDSVGLSIDSAGEAINITSTTDGAAEDFTIALAGATDSSLILSSTGTGADALQITTTAGGIDITSTGAAAGEDIDITTNASINLTSTENAANAILLHANGGTSEIIKIHSDQGTLENSILLLSDAGGIELSAGSTSDGINIATGVSGVPVKIGHTTSETTINDNLNIVGDIKVTTDNTDHSILQHDGREVARIHDGGATQTDTDMTSVGEGFGFKRPVLAVTADAGDKVVTLAADDSGAIIQCDADTNSISFTLPAIDSANKAGLTYTFVNTTAVAGGDTITISTAGTDGNDKFLMYGFNGASSITDVDGDTLTIPASSAVGTVVEVTCLSSGASNAAEIWLAKVFGASAVTNG